MLFIKWMDAYLFHTLYAWYFLVHAFLMSVFFNNLFKKNPPLRNTLRLSNSLDPDQVNKMSGLIWTNAFCKDNKQRQSLFWHIDSLREKLIILLLNSVNLCFLNHNPAKYYFHLITFAMLSL